MTAVALGPKTSQELVFKTVKNRKRCGLYFVAFVDRQKVRPIDRSLFFSKIMHQSIAAVPIPPPPGNRRAFAHVLSLGDGAFAILSQAGGWALAYPGATPEHLTHVFSKDG